jgi:opacity protein-like surface antigen
MKRQILGIFAVVALAPALSMAQESAGDARYAPQFNHTGYFGVGVGQSKYSSDSCAALLECETQDSAYKIYVGGRAYNILGLELAFLDFGRVHRNDGSARAQAGDLSLVLNAPLGDYFAVFAKGGGTYAWTRTRSDVPLVATGNDEGFDWGFGGGVSANFSPNWAVRAEWERHRLPFAGVSERVDMWSAGLRYKF